MNNAAPVGALLRNWRERRRYSQLDLALDSDISPRHLSFLENGRARPGRETLLRIAERLAIPLRERNRLLLAAGFAPTFEERPLDDPAMQEARRAIELLLRGHEPYPAIAVDRHWNLVLANRAAGRFLHGVDPSLLGPPCNVMRASLHPQGIAPRIENYVEFREHVLVRLRQQVDASADQELAALHEELAAYPYPPAGAFPSDAGHVHRGARVHDGAASVVIPMKLRTAVGVLSFFSTITVFGTPVDITLSELAIESFFPADRETAERLRALGSQEKQISRPDSPAQPPSGASRA
jgi:transcriptional regulator with XRE-family HTH domain